MKRLTSILCVIALFVCSVMTTAVVASAASGEVSLAIGNVEETSDKRIVTVPLSITKNAGIWAMIIELHFDPTALEFRSVRCNTMNVVPNVYEPGDVKIVFDAHSMENVTKTSGDLATFEFGVLKAGVRTTIRATTPDPGSNITINFQERIVTVAEGSVTVGPLYGDANDDLGVNMKDVLVMRKFLSGMNVAINMTNADTNADGAVNMKDVLLLRKYLANLVTSLPDGTPSTKPTTRPTTTPTTKPTAAPFDKAEFLSQATEAASRYIRFINLGHCNDYASGDTLSLSSVGGSKAAALMNAGYYQATRLSGCSSIEDVKNCCLEYFTQKGFNEDTFNSAAANTMIEYGGNVYAVSILAGGSPEYFYRNTVRALTTSTTRPAIVFLAGAGGSIARVRLTFVQENGRYKIDDATWSWSDIETEYGDLAAQISAHYNASCEAKGNYNVVLSDYSDTQFDAASQTLRLVLRYQLSTAEALEMRRQGMSVPANMFMAMLTVDLSSGLVTSDNDGIFSGYSPWYLSL